jgi:hypothetical protein
MKKSRINMYKNALFATLLTVTLLSGVNIANAAQAITFTSPSDYYQQTGAVGNIVGWSFTANQDLYATRLAVFDTDRDISPEPNHFIGLWQDNGFDAQGYKLAATLLRSVTVVETGARPTGFAYHWANIDQATLKAGQTYIVGAVMGSDYYTAQIPDSIFGYGDPTPFGNLQVNPLISYGSDAFYNLAYAANGVITESTNQLIFGSASVPDNIIGGFGANLDVVATPIPAAAWLLGSGLLGLVGIRRRNK